MLTHHTIAKLLVILGFVAAGLVAARAEACTDIPTVPSVITVSGSYCLNQNLSINSATAVAIDIEVDDVSLDLQGWTLSNDVATLDTNVSVGILVNHVRRVMIRNGAIRAFNQGVRLDYRPFDVTGTTDNGAGPMSGHVVEDLRVANLRGQRPRDVAAFSRGAVVRHNVIEDVTVVSNPLANDAIWIYGDAQSRLIDNDIIRNDAVNSFGLVALPHAIVIGNRISRVENGMQCQGSPSAKIRDNVVDSTGPQGYGGCQDIGNNH